MNIVTEIQQILKGNRVVWMQPTGFSPACKFSFSPRGSKAFSLCGMWLAPFVPEKILTLDEMQRKRVEKCQFCSAGKTVKQDMSDVPAKKNP